MTTAPSAPASIDQIVGPLEGGNSCPACGGENAAESAFCAGCHKALGPFRYVTETVATRTGWHQRVAGRVAEFVGRPQFLVTHALWFAGWVAVNTGVVAMVRHFDGYPFSLLGILLSMEAILLTGFLLINQNQQEAFANLRAEMDHEVSVRTYRRLLHIEHNLERLMVAVAAGEAPAASEIGQQQ